MNQNDLAILRGIDPISVALACHHDYVDVDGTEQVVCTKCGLETTVTALVRNGFAVLVEDPPC